MSDKVMSPPKKADNRTGIVQVKSSIIEGPTWNTGNLNPYNRKESKPMKEKK